MVPDVLDTGAYGGKRAEDGAGLPPGETWRARKEDGARVPPRRSSREGTGRLVALRP